MVLPSMVYLVSMCGLNILIIFDTNARWLLMLLGLWAHYALEFHKKMLIVVIVIVVVAIVIGVVFVVVVVLSVVPLLLAVYYLRGCKTLIRELSQCSN